METLYNGYTLDLCSGAFPLSTDAIVLAGFVSLSRNCRVLDLGSGCGTLGLLLCARDASCRVTGVELEPAAHETALENARRNGLESRLDSICGDLRRVSLPAGAFHCCVSNPPYFSGGKPHTRIPLARQETLCTMPELFAAAGRALRFGGDFYLVHRPERLAELCACAADAGMSVKRLCLVRHREGGPVSLVLLQCRKGAKPGMRWQEWTLHDAQGCPTAIYRTLYHLAPEEQEEP